MSIIALAEQRQDDFPSFIEWMRQRTQTSFRIRPYRIRGTTWVFDDPTRALEQEPFVCGAEDIISELMKPGVVFIHFDSRPFPEKHFVAVRKSLDPNNAGATYEVDFGGRVVTGWLCPATLKYFGCYPERFYALGCRCSRWDWLAARRLSQSLPVHAAGVDEVGALAKAAGGVPAGWQ